MTLPNPESLLVQALRARPELTAITGQEIRSRLTGTYPAIRVTLLGGPSRPVDQTGQPEFQVECWGNGTDSAAELQASRLGMAVEEAATKLRGTYAAGTIISSYTVGYLLHSPAGDTNRERYIVQIGLVVQ